MSPAPIPPAAAPKAAPAPAAAAAAPPPAAAAAAPAGAKPGADPASLPGGKEVLGLMESTKAIDSVWADSAVQAQSAVAALGKDAKLPVEAQGSITRLAFIGTVLGEKVPQGARPVALPKGANPADVIVKAEQKFVEAVAAAAQKTDAVGKALPQNAAEDVVKGYMLASERVTDAIYAVKFSMRIAPPPAPPADKAPANTQPGSAPAANGKPAPAPAANAAPTAAPAPAAAASGAPAPTK